MEVSLRVGCLPSAVGKQPTDPCLDVRMTELSYLGVMLWSLLLNDDDE